MPKGRRRSDPYLTLALGEERAKRWAAAAAVPMGQAADGITTVAVRGPILDAGWAAYLRDWGEEAVSAKDVQDALAKAEGHVQLRINSPGGEIWQGVAIGLAVDEYRKAGGKVTAVVEGFAGSEASLVMLHAERVDIASRAEIWIHLPWTVAVGSAQDLASAADGLRQHADAAAAKYAAKMGISDEAALGLMRDEKSWVGQAAVDAKIVDGLYAAIGADEPDDAPAPSLSIAQMFTRRTRVVEAAFAAQGV